MLKINENYLNLKESYLFADIGARVRAFQKNNPEREIIRLGIGDVTQPICHAVVDEMQRAVLEMGNTSTFLGYGPEQGYGFLRTALQGYYAKRHIELQDNEIFVSDGAKSDLGNILDIFSTDNKVLVPDPVYPVYVDTNIMAGRNIAYMNATKENDFLPMPDDRVDTDIIYLCSPNNPTGAVYSRSQLVRWVEYAKRKNAIILFDSAYERFIQDPNLPRSIYEIEGAKSCAIEFCSFSKTAGFTGLRCGYTVVPEMLTFGDVKLNKLWLRRQTTKFNGVSCVIQRGAAAVFTAEGQREIDEQIAYYQENARILMSALGEKGIQFTGGVHSPYIWLTCPNNLKSWTFFDYLLENIGVVGTPGAGFGANGEGFFRLTAFGKRENIQKAVVLLKNLL